MKKSTYKLLSLILFFSYVIISFIECYCFNTEIVKTIVDILVFALGFKIISIAAFICVCYNLTFKKIAMIVGIVFEILNTAGAIQDISDDPLKMVPMSFLLSCVLSIPYVSALFLMNKYHSYIE